jgi:hypothetical protein
MIMKSLVAVAVLTDRQLAALGSGGVADALVGELAARCEPPASAPPFTLGVVLGGEARTVRIAGGRAAVEPTGGAAADVVLRTDPATLHRSLFGADDRRAPARLSGLDGAPELIEAYRRGFADDTDLTGLAVRFGSDKWGSHFYTPWYARHFAPLRDRPLTVIEIGVGGYEDTGAGGGSLRMWERYFRRALVYGVDLHAKPAVGGPRVRVLTGHQADPAFLRDLLSETGPPDLVIDDGSHISRDVIATFEALFPALGPGGLYVVEDLLTSYWPGWGGDATDHNRTDTSVGFLTARVDGLNHEEFLPETGYRPTYTDRHIVGLHFYHNLAVVEKGENNEGGAPAYVPRAIRAAAQPAPA